MNQRVQRVVSYCLLFAVPAVYAQRGRPRPLPKPRPLPMPGPAPTAEIRPELRPEIRPEQAPQYKGGNSERTGETREPTRVSLEDFLNPRNNESWQAQAFENPNARLIRYLATKEISLLDHLPRNSDTKLQLARAELAEWVFKLGRYETMPGARRPTRMSRRWAILTLDEEVRQRRGTVEAHLAIPSTPLQYQAVFGSRPTAHATNEMRKAASEAEGQFGLSTPDVFLSSKTFADVVKATSAQYFVVVGHNANGEFTFLDGSRKPIREMIQDVAEHGKVPIFVSCKAKQVIEQSKGSTPSGEGMDKSGALPMTTEVTARAAGTAGMLTLSQGVLIAKAITVFIQKNGSASPAQVARMLERLEVASSRRLQVRLYVQRGSVLGGSLIVVAIVVYLLQDSDDSRKQRNRKQTRTDRKESERHFGRAVH